MDEGTGTNSVAFEPKMSPFDNRRVSHQGNVLHNLIYSELIHLFHNSIHGRGIPMVIAIAVYKFELNPSKDGEIEPEFTILTSEIAEEHSGVNLRKLVATNDLFAIFFAHTAGSSAKQKTQGTQNVFVGRLKETQYKVISNYKQEIDQSQYMTITIFKLDEDAEIYEGLIRVLAGKLDEQFLRLAKGNLKDINFVMSIKQAMQNELKFTIFQIGRLGNLEKVQKLALIYASPERLRTLDILRGGPVSRKALTYELEKIKDNPNVDIILKPFLELNLVRRDWARGTKDMKTGIVHGEGEFIFLIKDAALVRSPPPKIKELISKDSHLRSLYEEKSKNFFDKYDPFSRINEESRFLAKFLLDPDLFDFFALLKEKYFPVEKIPKITSEFANSKTILEELTKGEVACMLKEKGTEWFVLLSEITPIVIFPEYIVSKIRDRVTAKSKGEDDEISVDAPLTLEVAKRGFELLEATYQEKVQF